jgi:hypothetical protein
MCKMHALSSYCPTLLVTVQVIMSFWAENALESTPQEWSDRASYPIINVFNKKLRENIVSLVQKIQKFKISVSFNSLQGSCSLKCYILQSVFHIHNSIGLSILQGQNVLFTYQKAIIRLHSHMQKYKKGQSLITILLKFSHKTEQSLVTTKFLIQNWAIIDYPTTVFLIQNTALLIPMYFSYKTEQSLITTGFLIQKLGIINYSTTVFLIQNTAISDSSVFLIQNRAIID